MIGDMICAHIEWLNEVEYNNELLFVYLVCICWKIFEIYSVKKFQSYNIL